MTCPEPVVEWGTRAWRWFKGTSMPFWTARTLARPNEPAYMRRYHLLVTRWLVVYLNAILTQDNDERLHTHPWERAWSLKLWGWYIEELPGELFRIPGRLSRIPEKHRIVHLNNRPVWTLFFGLGAKRPWGFENPDGSLDVKP